VYENIRNMDNLTPQNAPKCAHLKPILQEIRGVEAKMSTDCGFWMPSARHFAPSASRFSYRRQALGVGQPNGCSGTANSTTGTVPPNKSNSFSYVRSRMCMKTLETWTI
jgi:hypothetical protein